MLQLGKVSRAEFAPPLRVVMEPLAQLCAGRNVLQPDDIRKGSLRDASWPEALYQKARAVGLCERVVHTLQLNVPLHAGPPNGLMSSFSSSGPLDAETVLFF